MTNPHLKEVKVLASETQRDSFVSHFWLGCIFRFNEMLALGENDRRKN